jgi:very-short-patch-repair endonuclease
MDVVALLEDTGRRTQGLGSAARLAAAGVPRWALARAVHAEDIVRVRPRVYASAALPPLPQFVVTDKGVSPTYVLHVRAVLLSFGVLAAACGRTAAALYGWGLLVEPSRTVEVSVPHGRGSLDAPGVRCRQRRGAPCEPVTALGDCGPLRMTTPVQTVLDCALWLPLLQAVVICDSALRAKAVTVEELVRAFASLPGVKQAAQARRVLDLCDPLSGSVLESVLRVQLCLAGLTDFTTQVVLAVRPQVLRVDFCFAAAGLVVEVDGARWHQDAARDQARDNVLATLGWRVLRLSWADVVHRPEQAISAIRAALCATPSLHLAAQLEEIAA